MLKFGLTHPAMRDIATILFAALLAPASAHAQTPAPYCDMPLDIVRLANPLPRMSQLLASGQPIKIVAIGSSSTAGAGASAPTLSYPSRLQVELTEQFPGHKFIVVNRGVNGEEAKDMLRRFDAQVVAEKPDLVLWQLGTNAVLRDHPMDNGATIRAGLNILKRTGADIILIDPQYAPKVIAKPDVERMVQMIGATAKSENVDLFQRFAAMRHWHDDDHLGFETFVSADGLHMNDWSYNCLAKGVAAAIAEAALRQVESASALLYVPW